MVSFTCGIVVEKLHAYEARNSLKTFYMDMCNSKLPAHKNVRHYACSESCTPSITFTLHPLQKPAKSLSISLLASCKMFIMIVRSITVTGMAKCQIYRLTKPVCHFFFL